MAKVLLLRMASGAGLVALAALFVGAVPFLDAGVGHGANTPAVTVNRALKGDRLDVAPDWNSEFRALRSQEPRAQIPFGCDPAFSPIFAPAAQNVYRRCMA